MNPALIRLSLLMLVVGFVMIWICNCHRVKVTRRQRELMKARIAESHWIWSKEYRPLRCFIVISGFFLFGGGVAMLVWQVF